MGGQYKERQVARDILPPFLSALQYLHGRHIIHRCGPGAGAHAKRSWQAAQGGQHAAHERTLCAADKEQQLDLSPNVHSSLPPAGTSSPRTSCWGPTAPSRWRTLG